jgi:hypothetical protein
MDLGANRLPSPPASHPMAAALLLEASVDDTSVTLKTQGGHCAVLSAVASLRARLGARGYFARRVPRVLLDSFAQFLPLQATY